MLPLHFRIGVELLHDFAGDGRITDAPVEARPRLLLRVIDAPSCSVLELEDGVLVPFVSDAIRSVGEAEILIDEDFLG